MRWSLFLLVVITSTTFAQTENVIKEKIDSLKKELEAANDNSSKAKIYHEIVELYKFSTPDSAVEYVQHALAFARKIKSDSLLSSVLAEYSGVLDFLGNNTQAIYYGLEALKIAERSNNLLVLANAFDWLADTYAFAGDFEHAIYYRLKAKSIFEEFPPSALSNVDTVKKYLSILSGFAHIYDTFNVPDSVLKYLKLIYQYSIRIYGTVKYPDYYNLLGNYYLNRGDYDSAMLQYHSGIRTFNLLRSSFATVGVKGGSGETSNPDVDIWNASGLAEVHARRNKRDSALYYANRVLQISLAQKMPRIKLRALNLLADIYKSAKNSDSAAKYLELIIATKDSQYNQQKIIDVQNLTFNETMRQVDLQKAQAEFRSKIIRYLSFAGLAMLLILAIILYRSREKQLALVRSEKEKQFAEMKRNAIELEMQALRAQMNPHFIFNCLNSINRFILRHDSEAASDYLTRFSRLIRMVLNNSKETVIPLQDEMECLKLYLQMEQLRFSNAFSYSFNIDKNVNTEEVTVPPLLLQPFVENAIWHGLMSLHEHQSNTNKEGKITIDIKAENGLLLCSVEDNGIGRKKAAELSAGKEKKRSLGMHITKERMKLFVLGEQNKKAIEVVDLVDETGNATGTRVIIYVPIKTLDEAETITMRYT